MSGYSDEALLDCGLPSDDYSRATTSPEYLLQEGYITVGIKTDGYPLVRLTQKGADRFADHPTYPRYILPKVGYMFLDKRGHLAGEDGFEGAAGYEIANAYGQMYLKDHPLVTRFTNENEPDILDKEEPTIRCIVKDYS